MYQENVNQKYLNEQVTGYINEAPDEQKKIMETVRRIIHENVKGVQEEFKWSRPVFWKTTDIIYFKSEKNYVTVGFFQYHKLDDQEKLLEGTGKDMRHLKIRHKDEVNEALLVKWLKTLTT